MNINVVYFKSSTNMEEVEDNSVHLIVTSPPYFNVKDYSQNGERKEEDVGGCESYEEYLELLLKVFTECERVLVPNGKLCINAPLMPLKKESKGKYPRQMLNIPADIHCLLKQIPTLKFYDMYIWERTNWTKKLMFGSYPYPPNFYAQNYCEFIYIYVKEGDPVKRTKEQKELSKLSQKEWLEYTSQIWRIPVPSKSDPAYGIHPAIMPEEIAKRLIKLYSFVGDIVLDPFAGSGTTLAAAKKLGRKYIGYELYEKYKPVIEQKLSINFPTLFE